MGVAVYGLPRSGTTLISDLLTVPGRSIVMSEPDLYKMWNRNIAKRLHALAGSVGIELDGIPEPDSWDGLYANYIRRVLAPRFSALDSWGMKFVDFSDWRRQFAEFPPAKLVLCLRDLRDVVLSGVDRIARMPLVFRSAGTRRDEAWVLCALAYNVWELMAMRQHPHFAIRYEDVATTGAPLDALAAYVGLPGLDPTRNNLAAAGWHRRWEVEKHGDGISAASVARFDREPHGPIRALAERLWRLIPEYGEAFGYDVPPTEARIEDHAFRPSEPGRNPVAFIDTEKAKWPGPACIEPSFARRRARPIVARNLQKFRRVLDLGGGSRALVDHLAKGTVHIPADNVARADDVRVADIYGGTIPPADDADVIVAIDVLEYVEELPRLLASMRAAGKPVFVTYHATDDSAGTDRAALGWRNAYDRAGLVTVFEAARFSVTPLFAFDGAQSLFRLRPV